MTDLNKSLPPLPARMKHLPINYQGFPVPWFVQWIKDGYACRYGDGEPEFRCADSDKWSQAIKNALCWVCGGQLGRYKAFVIGSMCAVNRVTSEPPCHLECAKFSATACPFLSKPRMRRHNDGLPDDVMAPPGIHLPRNPGVACVWVTRSFKLFKADRGALIELGDPVDVQWYAEGRSASRAEVMASIDGGYPELLELARQECDEAVTDLAAKREIAMAYLP